MISTIICEPFCGFANRLKFLASIDGIAKKLKCKDVKVLWKKTLDCNISHTDIFDKIGGFEFISETEVPPKEDMLYYGYIHMDSIQVKLKEEHADKNILLIEGGHESKYMDTSFVDFMKIKHKFYNSIVWSKELRTKLENFGDVPTIGIHYRHVNKTYDSADVKANPLINFSLNSPFSEFEEFIKKNKQKMFFISNSLYHKKYMEDKYSKKLSIIHNDEDNERNSKESMLNSVFEFILLTKCELIVGSYFSSFSDEASYFNMIPKVMPILPKIMNNESDIHIFKRQYHSVNKPCLFDKYLVLNPDMKKLINTI